jgi:hypothetical protein
MKITCLLLAVAMALPVEAVAEQPDRFRLIGSPIYSSDGAEVGTIADIRLDEAGRLSAVRIDAAARLGFGTRQVEISGWRCDYRKRRCRPRPTQGGGGNAPEY